MLSNKTVCWYDTQCFWRRYKTVGLLESSSEHTYLQIVRAFTFAGSSLVGMHRLGPFAGLQHEIESQSNNVFVIRGSRLLGTEDADAHAAVEQCLVPWMGDEGNLMDRYDARMLLDDLSSFASSVRHGNSRSAEADLGATAEELCNERYADLDPSKEHLLATSGLPLHSGAFWVICTVAGLATLQLTCSVVAQRTVDSQT